MKKLVYLFLFLSIFGFASPRFCHEDMLVFSKTPSTPAGLSNFDAISDGKKVYVNWTVANERNYDYFTVEKSKDGTHFETATIIKGCGISSSIIDYSDIDYMPFDGISYYRIKQMDYFGQISYSEIATVNYLFSNNSSVVPNTANATSSIDFKDIEKKEILVVVKDAGGNEFFSKVIVQKDKDVIYATDPKNKLSQGTYLVMASSYNRLYSQKLIIK